MYTEIIKCIEQQPRCFQNVERYEHVEHPDFSWKITYERESMPLSDGAPIYYILDSHYHHAFSHWVYESSTWIPQYLEVLRKYPSCLLVLEANRGYKDLFLEYYGIPKNQIAFHSEMNPVNYTFFHTYTSFNDLHLPSIFYENAKRFHDTINRISPPKDISILYLPRGTKENIQGTNNRVYDIQNLLKEYILNIGGVVYETDSTTNLLEQISIVKRANIIVLDYGSNLWVNGNIARDSFLICLNIGWKQHTQFPSMKFLWDTLLEKNKLFEITAHSSGGTTEDGISIVKFHLPQIFFAIHQCLEITRQR